MSADIAHETARDRQNTMPAWTTPKQALVLCIQPQTLRRTVAIALLVGSVLSLIDQGGALASRKRRLRHLAEGGRQLHRPVLCLKCRFRVGHPATSPRLGQSVAPTTR